MKILRSLQIDKSLIKNKLFDLILHRLVQDHPYKIPISNTFSIT